jgi:succinoglycan biosynthesis transport protein ExoP
MQDESKILPRDPDANGTVEVVPASSRIPTIDLSPREPHLYDYLLILRKHQWLILSFLLAVVTIVTIATFRMKPVYIATAKIEIDRENTNILPFQGADSYDYMMDLDNYIETQSRVLTSETLALQTIRNAGLNADPEFANAAESEAIASGTLKNQKLPPEIGAFLGGLAVRRIPNTRLLEISFESTDPRAAARILNAHLDNYIEQNYKSRYEATTDASKWLQSELDELSVKVRRSEDARIEYERNNQIWAVDDKNNNVTTQRLADLNKELTDAQSDSLKKQALFEFAKAGEVEAVPEIRDNQVLTSLQEKRAELAVQYTDAVNQYGPNFPKVQRLQAQMKELDDEIVKERKGIVAQLESDYREAKQHEDLLSRALDEQKAEVNLMSEKMIQYNILKREAEANKSLYDSLQTKLKEAQISSGLKSSNIRVVDPAIVPSGAARPAKTRNIALAFLVGLVGGVGLALLREYLDNTVKTPDDIETLARLPSLAVVPAFGGGALAGKRSGFLKGASSENGFEKRIELVAQHLPKSQTSEAFRALRTALLLSQPGRPPQVILVTSALPREGKTTAAANLAVTLAQLGDKTVLLDADLRKPGVGRLLNLGSGKYAGMSSYLAGVSSLDLVTVPHPAIPNLAAIPTGPLPPNPADLLSSHKLAEAIAELRTKYKFVVIDSPPIMAATDAVILSVQADGVLLVVRSGETPKEAFTRTRDLLLSVKCRLLGVVLNAVDSSAPDYYYSYRYYPYSYGYGPQEALELSHEQQEETPAARAAAPPSSDEDDSDSL